MKKNIYISNIHAESMNFKTKILNRFKGRKYKHSNESLVPSVAFDTDEEYLKIAKNLSRTDVTVVLISRSILDSPWIEKEVALSLLDTDHFGKKIPLKGVIGVVIPDKGNDYSYMMKKGRKGIWLADKSKLPEIISNNMHNEKLIQNKNDINYDSFISVYRWEDFIRDFNSCVEIAADKAFKHLDDYNITR